VGAEQDDEYAARRAGLDSQFRALPLAGSAAYWQAVAEALPLEVLVRCFRDRRAAGAADDAERVYVAMLGRVQQQVAAWANGISRHAPKERAQALAYDLEQECFLALWRELCAQGDTFLAERFVHKLTRIEQHTAHQVMEREGLWQRPGVRKPTRVPGAETERLDTPRHDEESVPVGARLFDAKAEDAFARAELESDIQTVLDSLTAEDRALVYDRYWDDQPPDEIARRLGVTDRTVRNRLARIYAELRRLLGEPQEDANG
jgi:RNA polymerase sigma factor (sigma-70 family)